MYQSEISCYPRVLKLSIDVDTSPQLILLRLTNKSYSGMLNFKMINIITFCFMSLVVVFGGYITQWFPSSADQEHLLNTDFLHY